MFLKIKKILAPKNKKEIEIELAKRFIDAFEKQCDDVMNFKHDYIKIYSTMLIYLKNRNIDALSEYFTEKIAPLNLNSTDIIELTKSLSYISDVHLLSEFYSYIIKAVDKKIKVYVDIKEKISDINMETLTLCRIIGSLLENAVEACCNIKESEIHICIVKYESDTLFIIKNTCRTSEINIEKIIKKGYTTKEGKNKGRGLSIVKSLVDNCGKSSIDLYIENNMFVCRLYISG